MFTVQNIISTLNQVEVKGKENMDLLLGAILALEAIVKAQENEAQEEQENGG